ncbi:coiled-coil domain-containing protein 170-like [Sitophilus oryzae]|uniref:Coiled-coil domain-containing protein 170-like n=1 Tax=Sitophilus oryzae TaxID=7048 RepID=A0A6J2YV53_SITOR|nr:coiled-coil domain-containing protein 170-like [Sitophilus oryzae]
MESQPTESVASGNAEEDWEIYQILCEGDQQKEVKMEDHGEVDVTTSLRSEVAALQYKRDRLTQEVEEMRSQIRSRDQRCLELQMEAEQLREQSARQNVIISSLKKRVHELEERERNLFASQGRSEIALQTAQRDIRYNEEKAKEMESKVRHLELELLAEEKKKEAARTQFQDFVRRLSVALGADIIDSSSVSTEALVLKASELVQETSRLRNKAHNISDTLGSAEIELRTCRDNLNRALEDKEILQRQSANQIIEIDRLRQEKESLEMQHRVTERELLELKEKLAMSTRSLGSASGNIAQQESLICQLRDDLKLKEDKIQRLQSDQKHTLESIAILLSTPTRFVDSLEGPIKEKIHEILSENKEKSLLIDNLKDKLNNETQQLSRQISLYEQANSRIRLLEDEKNHLEARLHKVDAEYNSCELSRDGLKRDKCTFMNFLERLARALNMDEISHDIGVELHTESLLLRAEQLARLESDKLVDKLLCCGYGTLPRLSCLRRERSFHDIPLRDTSMVYQLQRRVRTLREQVQRKDLHLDLLRRKLSLQEDTAKTKCLLQSERDEANARVKKLVKQVDRLQLQLSEAKSQIRDLNSQLAEAADYKITALERGRKIEELQKRLMESETLRTKYNRKVTLLKDQIRHSGDTIDQERNISEHSMQILRDELARVKDTLSEVQRREAQLQSFKQSIAKILGVVLPMPDYELVSRLQKLVDAHHDFTLVSRRYDDPVLRLTARSPTGGSRCTRTPDRSRYDDSGYVDGVDLDNSDEDLYKRQGRQHLC